MQEAFSFPSLNVVIGGISQALQQSQQQEGSVGIFVVGRQMIKIVATSILLQTLCRICLSHAVDSLKGVVVASRLTGWAIQDWKLRAKHAFKYPGKQLLFNLNLCDKYMYFPNERKLTCGCNINKNIWN